MAELELAGLLRHALDQLVEHAAVRVEPRAGGADLAGIVEDRARCARHRDAEIGVREHDHGRLAAELERDVLEVARRGLDDQPPDFAGAGEGDLVDAGMGGERGARGLAEAGDDVDHAVGEASLKDELPEAQRRQRRLLGGFEHDRAAGRERGRELPRRHHQRRVPRDDLPDHADRLAQRVGVEVAGLREGDGFAGDLGGPAGHVAQHLGAVDEVGVADVDDRLAVVDRFKLGQFVLVRLDQVGELPHELGALAAGHFAPGARLECCTRGRDRGIDVSGAAFAYLRDHAPAAGIEGVERLARLRINPFAADEELVPGREEVLGGAAKPRMLERCVHGVAPSIMAMRRRDTGASTGASQYYGQACPGSGIPVLLQRSCRPRSSWTYAQALRRSVTLRCSPLLGRASKGDGR